MTCVLNVLEEVIINYGNYLNITTVCFIR